ncbi:hypothetical protein F7Q99_01345 [Streptomyces kaniharaensis]|uniref:DUF3426 domain-containing protein n=1 Tax=Streptomyces kaniharaensis TaxID=212423 RepID=A0A6N7KKK9_9ACTN|nr:hypothetical protein [Streptomyces kaniharaensis]MQS10958.1 hypothetical protein [Streptomyces kaniharaensis]
MRELHTLPSSRRWTAPRAAGLAAGLAAGAVLVACSSSSTNAAIVRTSSPTPSESASAAPSESASASAAASPSALASALASAAASAAAFAASADAQQVMVHDKAASVLAQEPDGGNALGSVTLTEVPREASGGLPAVFVTIENTGIDTASYAVQVDFTDTSGNTVDSAVVGAEHIPRDGQATPVAFSRRPTDERLLPVVVKAVRY